MNPNSSPLTNPVGPNDLIRLIQEGYTGHVTPRQLALGLPVSMVLAQSVTPFILTGTTVETTAALPIVPAGTWKPGGRLRIYTFGQSAAGRAGFWQYKIYFNNVLVASQNNATGIGSGSLVIDLFATSLNTQIAAPAAESLTSANLPTQFAADLTVDNAVKITMTNASATDTTQVLGYSIEVINQ